MSARRRATARALGLATLAAFAALAPGCGKKGPPLPPVPVEPQRIADLVVVQWGDTFAVTCSVPTHYTDGGPFELAEAEVYVLVDDLHPLPGPSTPQFPLLPLPLLAERGRLALDPLPPPLTGIAEPPPEPTQTPTPSPTPTPPSTPAPARPPVSGASAAAAASPSAAPVPTATPDRVRELQVLREGALVNRFTRDAKKVVTATSPAELGAVLHEGRLVFTLPVSSPRGRATAFGVRLRGFRKHDHGVFSNILTLESGDFTAPPGPVHGENLETGVRISVEAEADDVRPIAVFRRLGTGTVEPIVPLVPVPVGMVPPPPAPPAAEEAVTGTAALVARRPERTFLDTTVPSDATACYTVAAVLDARQPSVLTALAEPVCVKRRDTFGPEAPHDLQLFSSAEGVLVVWKASAATDLAGYDVYRTALGHRRKLNAAPLTETSYLDKGVAHGTSYTYEVTAVDRNTPANESAPVTGPPQRY